MWDLATILKNNKDLKEVKGKNKQENEAAKCECCKEYDKKQRPFGYKRKYAY